MKDVLVSQKIKYAPINATATGDNTIVAAVANKKIRVLSFILASGGSGLPKFTSSTTTDLTKVLNLAIAGTSTFVAPYNPGGWFETLSGELLGLNVDATDVTGCLSYIEV